MSLWQPLVVCGKRAIDETGDFTKACQFSDLIVLVKNLITDLVILSTFAATAVFIYIGVILLTSGGNENAKTRAKEMFKKVVIGFLWILAAWLVVYTITNALVKPEFGSLLGAPTPNK